ncbi:uncharacterized protein LOC143030242 [Oratosquilla oratoria]|uniref:uncharacterized protein LOC143030242 n=1 Tax=Oratosquilla oratoria TaxID=337810 RepID=UPI003F767FE6
MTLRIPLTQNRHLTLISVYAPTLVADDNIKNSFYNLLHQTIRKVPNSDKLIVLGDFNARVGRDHHLWSGIIGPHGTGNCNANGQLLLGLCAEHELIITNTLFRLPTRQKTTWRHPRSKHWHTLDYALTRTRNRKDVRITRSMPGADDCWTDHRLLISRLDIMIRRPPRRPTTNKPHPRFNCAKLQHPETAKNFQEAVHCNLRSLPQPDTTEEHWTTLRDAVTNAAEETLGFTKRKNQDWFSENDAAISQLINEKRKTRLAQDNHPSQENKRQHREATKTCPKRLREIQNTWWQEKANEIQNFFDQKDMYHFYAATKEIFGPTKSSISRLMEEDGITVLNDPQDILCRWKTHFEGLLNDHPTTPEDLLHRTAQHPIQEWMSEPPTSDDLTRAIKLMKPGKTPGPDNIPVEVLTHV